MGAFRQKRCGIKEQRPPMAHLIPAQRRSVATGETAGGRGAQVANLANVVAVALRANQETAARLAEAQDRDWRHVARCRHDLKIIESPPFSAGHAASRPRNRGPTTRFRVKEGGRRGNGQIYLQAQRSAGEDERLRCLETGGKERILPWGSRETS